MYYLDRKKLKIAKISKANIIKKFSEKVMTTHGEANKYFYENGNFYVWLENGTILSIFKKNINKKMADVALFKFAVANAEKQQIFFYDTVENLKTFEVLEWLNCLEIKKKKI